MSTDLVLRLSAQRYDIPNKQAADDAETTYARRPRAHVIGHTEADRTTELPGILSDAAHEHGYVYLGHPYGEALAVRDNLDVMADGFIHVHGPSLTPAGRPLHMPRGIRWVRFRLPNGKVVMVGVAHWSTRKRAEGLEHQVAMAEAAKEFLSEASEGVRLGFLLADTNADDHYGKRDALGRLVRGTPASGALVSVFDELGKHPPTHNNGGTIDNILRIARRDAQVNAVKVVVHKRQHKDHRDVTATYRVKP